jgi:archaellum component FlaG (FlaF/FlaG flagellin family)
MKRFFWRILITSCFLVPLPVAAQDLRLPRDPEKLMLRAQNFWAAIGARQRLQALDFVLPEKKDLFFSGNVPPIVSAKVLGLDLTTDINHAAIRVNLEVLNPLTGLSRWTATDSWVWRRGTWYVDLANALEVFPRGNPANPVVAAEVQRQIEKDFEILRNPVDVGTLIQGEPSRTEVPIRYTGDAPISIDVALQNPLVDLEYESSSKITAASKSFVLLIDTSHEGPFNFPLPLKISSGGVSVERTVLVKGTVFAPVTFRQEPADGPIVQGENFSVFVRNNTAEEAKIRYITVDGKLLIMKQPGKLPPNEEVEVVLRLKPDEIPDRLYLVLDTPIHDRSSYTYRFRNVRRQ